MSFPIKIRDKSVKVFLRNDGTYKETIGDYYFIIIDNLFTLNRFKSIQFIFGQTTLYNECIPLVDPFYVINILMRYLKIGQNFKYLHKNSNISKIHKLIDTSSTLFFIHPQALTLHQRMRIGSIKEK